MGGKMEVYIDMFSKFTITKFDAYTAEPFVKLCLKAVGDSLYAPCPIIRLGYYVLLGGGLFYPRGGMIRTGERNIIVIITLATKGAIN